MKIRRFIEEWRSSFFFAFLHPTINLGNYLSQYIQVLVFFFFWPCPWHVEIIRPGIKAALWQWPRPRQGQCWFLNPLSHQGTLCFLFNDCPALLLTWSHHELIVFISLLQIRFQWTKRYAYVFIYVSMSAKEVSRSRIAGSKDMWIFILIDTPHGLE